MKIIFNRLVATILILVLLSSLGTALAVGTDYADIKGHWAETTLIRAINDTLIVETEGNFKPNEPMTGAEILRTLCSILSAKRTADISGVTDIEKNDANYITAALAVALGLASPVNGELDLSKPVTRSKAFAILTEAFQLNSANPDTSVLAKYSDGNTLSGRFRLAAATLVAGGFVEGFDGSLHINNYISLAEFMTVLYKIIPNYLVSGQNFETAAGGTVVSGSTPLVNMTFDGNVYFDCSSSVVQLQHITAPAVILRSDVLNTLSISSSKIDRLVFASGSGDLYVSPEYTSIINTAVVGTGGGKLTFGGSISNIEIIGSNRDVTLTNSVKNLLISGSNNKIVMTPGVTIDNVKVLGTGSGNTLTVNGFILECDIFSPNTVIDGIGTVRTLLDNSKNSTVTASVLNAAVNKDYGLNGVELTLSAPDNVASYETLKASVSIKAPAGSMIVRGAWYIDDLFISQSDVSVGTTSEVMLNSAVKNESDAPESSILTYILSFVNSGGDYQEIRIDKNITLLNANKFDAAEVLALVSTGYKGDYTLAWAETHDYDSAVKAAWVNAKGYASKTDYLVWVNITYQRVNIFTGSAGNWTLINTFIVGTGATGRDTPTGVFSIIGRHTRGWTTKTYTVKPVINFFNYAYGFHSRLYSPGTTTVIDARIGFPISHGCVRMYDNDVAWIYDNIPTNTAVVVY